MTVHRVRVTQVRRPCWPVRLVAWWLLRTRYRIVEERGAFRVEVKRRGQWTFGRCFPEGDRWRCDQAAVAGAVQSARGFQGFARLTRVGYVRMLAGR